MRQIALGILNRWHIHVQHGKCLLFYVLSTVRRLLTLFLFFLYNIFHPIVCPRNLFLFYKVGYYIKRGKTSWTYSMFTVQGASAQAYKSQALPLSWVWQAL